MDDDAELPDDDDDAEPDDLGHIAVLFPGATVDGHPSILPLPPADWSPASAAQAVIDGRAGHPALDVMRCIDHYLVRAQPLPSIVLDALAKVLRITRTVAAQMREVEMRRAWEAGERTAETTSRNARRVRSKPPLRSWPNRAAALEAVRTITAAAPMGKQQHVALHAVLRWFSEHGQPLDLATRRAVAEALGLLDAEGQWREQVVVAVVHDGLRRPDLFAKAVEVEARARLRLQKQANLDRAIAKRHAELIRDRDLLREAGLSAVEVDEIMGGEVDSLDAPRARQFRIPSRPDLRRDAWQEQRTLRDEIIDDLQRRDLRSPSGVAADAIAERIGVDARTVEAWIARPEWDEAVYVRAVYLSRTKRTRTRNLT
ncbi:hypothetical protein ATER59S_01676 [Aquamicrobium terrae]